MPPEENREYEMFLMNENGEPVKFMRFSEMPKCEIGVQPSIDLKELYDTKYEGKIELTPESEAELAKLQKQVDAEIIENLKKQIKSVNYVIDGLKEKNLPVYCREKLYRDAIAIAEAYKIIAEHALKMMEERT